uniref:RNase III domain-containing protein n=1 Tax=Steinernema glaseri TaxID=37863 RepID=A0A1I8AD64_9BILA
MDKSISDKLGTSIVIPLTDLHQYLPTNKCDPAYLNLKLTCPILSLEMNALDTKSLRRAFYMPQGAIISLNTALYHNQIYWGLGQEALAMVIEHVAYAMDRRLRPHYTESDEKVGDLKDHVRQPSIPFWCSW